VLFKHVAALSSSELEFGIFNLEFSPSDIPAGLHRLFKASCPILRYRLLRDVLEHDESWKDSAALEEQVLKSEYVQSLASQQEPSGAFSGHLLVPLRDPLKWTTEHAILHLCECGAERHPAVKTAIDRVLLPTLAQEQVTWEVAVGASNDDEKREARRLVRDCCLDLLARTTRREHPMLDAYIELLIMEWENWLRDSSMPAPTASAYSSLCLFRENAETKSRIHSLLKKVLDKLEAQSGDLPIGATLLTSRLLRVPSKQEYYARPGLFLHDLELGARAGLVGEVPHLTWLYDELEPLQDADGFFRFPESEIDYELRWYLPLESSDHKSLELDFTLRAHIIFKLLNYDV
jgi:hypothetical protein